MRARYFPVMALSALLALGGCRSMDVSLSDYRQEVPLDAAPRLPTEADLERLDRARVVLFEAEDGDLEKARRAQAATTLTLAIEELLGANGVEVVDRGIAADLGRELQLAEVKGVAGYDGPALANYAVKPTITQAEYATEYVPPTKFYDKRGKAYYIPESFRHRAGVNISLRVYEIPSLRPVKTLNGQGRNTLSSGDRGSRDMGVSMIRAATKAALGDVRAELLNLFAPRGYVIGKRMKGNDSILRISIGSAQGLVPGNKVVIFTEQENVNPITRKTSYDRIPVVSGTVSGIVTANEAWIVPEDEAKARRVRLGDQIEVVHKDSSRGTLFLP